MIKVAVCGANGKMGKTVCEAVESDSLMSLVAKIDIKGDGYKTIEEAKSYCEIDVLVDFTQPASIYENAKYCLKNGINIVIGTTGLKDEEIAYLQKLSSEYKSGCIIAPNFSTGAVLMMQFAKWLQNILIMLRLLNIIITRKKTLHQVQRLKRH